jgi:hypothetical protein
MLKRKINPCLLEVKWRMMDAGPNGISKLSLEVKMTILMLLSVLSIVPREFQDPPMVGRSPPLGTCGLLTLKPPISI